MCKSMVCLSSKEFCNEEDDSRTSVIRLFGRTIAVSSNEISQSKKKGPKGRSRDSDGERSAERGPKSLKRETGLQRNDPVPQTGAVCGEPESNAEFVTSLKLPWRDSLEKSLSEKLATSFNSVMPSCEDMTRSFNLNSRCLLTEEISRSLNFVKHSNEDISSSFSFAKHSNEETSRSSNFAKHANEEISRSWKEQISLPLNFQAFSNEEASRSLSVLRPSTKEHIPESLKLLKNEDTESSADSFQLLHQNEASKSEKSVKGSQKTDKPLPKPGKPVPCPRCDSMETKFCYFNNYNVNQPRHFCRNCRRYWTAGGTIRNIPVGAGRRKSKHFQGAPRTLELHDGNLKSPSNDSSETAKFFAQSLEDSHTVGLFNSLINNQAFKGNNNSSSSASSWIPGIEFKAASHANFVSGGQSIIQKLTRQD